MATENDKYEYGAKVYHTLYPSRNFYKLSTATQKQWNTVMKDFFNEAGLRRNS